MTDSTEISDFDPDAVEAELIGALTEGRLVKWLTKNRLFRRDGHYQEFCDALIQAHNLGKVDLISAALSEPLRGDGQRDFWMLQDLFVNIIPRLDAHPDTLMDAIVRFVDEGGEDMAATRPNGAFREWLKFRPDETQQLLLRAQQGPEPIFELLTFILEAGATQDSERYQSATIEFLSSEHQEYRLAAVTALGRIDVGGNEHQQQASLNALCELALETGSARERASAIKALLDVYARNPDFELAQVLATIEAVNTKPSSEQHYFLATALGSHHAKFTTELQEAIIKALHTVDPAMKGVVDQIDFAFSQCLNQDNWQAIADCLEKLLDHTETPLDIADLDSFVHRLTDSHPEFLGWLVVRWLRFGSHRARLSLPTLFRRFATDGYEINLPLDQFALSDEELCFISRKALGYFLIEAATVASILVACLRAASGQSAAQTIADLLFEPLMINFSGQARDVVEKASKNGPRQKYLRTALKAHDAYLDGLRSVPKIAELLPTPSQRQVQSELQRKQFSESFKAAEASSVMLQVVTRQTLLFGAGSVTYVRDADGQLRRVESMLSSHGTSVEFPRFETIDPLQFQHLVLHFRRETFET